MEKTQIKPLTHSIYLGNALFPLASPVSGRSFYTLKKSRAIWTCESLFDTLYYCMHTIHSIQTPEDEKHAQSLLSSTKLTELEDCGFVNIASDGPFASVYLRFQIFGVLW